MPADQFLDRGRRGDVQRRVAARAKYLEKVILAPHHALGHAGRAARVEQQQVIARAAPGRCDRARRRGPADDGFVVVGPSWCWETCLSDGDPGLHRGQSGANSFDDFTKAGMEDDGFGIGIVEQVDQFLGAIAVVGVDGREAGLEGGEIGLKVLRPVVEEGCDLGLAWKAGREQMGGQSVGAGVELAPGDHALILDQRRAVGLSRRDRFPNVREGPRHVRRLTKFLFVVGRMADCRWVMSTLA